MAAWKYLAMYTLQAWQTFQNVVKLSMHYNTGFNAGCYHSYCHSNIFGEGRHLAEIENWRVSAYHVDGSLRLLGQKWVGGHLPGSGHFVLDTVVNTCQHISVIS